MPFKATCRPDIVINTLSIGTVANEFRSEIKSRFKGIRKPGPVVRGLFGLIFVGREASPTEEGDRSAGRDRSAGKDRSSDKKKKKS